MFKVPEQYRLKKGAMASSAGHGNNGVFVIDRGRTRLFIVASDGAGWEHVSIHCVSDMTDRTPTWAEMCFVKSLFWGEEDCVVQYHPAKSEYVNTHPHTLHLWRPTEHQLPVPPTLLV